MGVYTITEKDKADFEIFFDSETYANIGTKGFFTICYIDDEGFAFESEVTYSADLPEEIKVKNTSKNMDKYFIYRLEVPEIDSLEEMEYGY